MLALARQKFISDLTSNYSDVSEKKTWSVYANRECDAIHQFIIKAMPMTLISTSPGPVNGYRTAGPVKGKAIGGLDKRGPGVGLPTARKILEQDLLNAYTHRDVNNPHRVQAAKIAAAIEKYMLSAIVRTKEITKGPLPAPATSGPVQGPIDGLGGVLSDKPGIGYKAAKPRFKQAMTAIYSRINQNYPHSQKAKEIADAIHAFAIEGIIKTKGTFIAGAAVNPKSGDGSYFPGQGQSITGTLS